MQALINIDPKERLVVIPQSKIRFNVRVDHPKTNWKRIEIHINYNPIFSRPPCKYVITEKNEINMSSLTEELTIVEKRLGEVPLGDIIVNVDGEERSQYLPTVRIMSLDAYFEEKVAEKLRELEFEAIRLGGPGRPDVEANPKTEPTQRVQVEATLEDHYNVQRFRNDIGKFHHFKRARQYKRLLIVVNSDKISDVVVQQLRRTTDPISLIRYEHLENLVSHFLQGRVSKYQVIAVLMARTGLVDMENLT
jgi:hypothetical protein